MRIYGTYDNRVFKEIIDHPFNFTEYIKDDFSTFLQVYLEAHPKTTDNYRMDQIWRQTAEQSFGETIDKGNGLFNKLFLDCSFKKTFMTAGNPLPGECDLFQQTLTSNGLCLSFNTVPPSDIWKEFKVVKALEEIMTIKPTKNSFFSGAGANDGKLLTLFYKAIAQNICVMQLFGCISKVRPP